MIQSLLAFFVMTAPVTEITKDITYRTVGGTTLQANFYKPAKPMKEPMPFVVVIHGGSWISGNRADMAALCSGLADQGIASATISYRLAPTNKWPAQIEDVQAAVRFFRANAAKYNISADNFAISGASAGGHLAMLAAFSDPWEKNPAENGSVSTKVSCVLNLFGPTDLTEDFPTASASMISQLVLGKKYDKSDADIKKVGPIAHIKKGAPPVFTIHGDADQVVPVKQAGRLDDALKAVGTESVVKIIPGMGHTIDTGNEECVKALSDAITFLKKNLSK